MITHGNILLSILMDMQHRHLIPQSPMFVHPMTVVATSQTFETSDERIYSSQMAGLMIATLQHFNLYLQHANHWPSPINKAMAFENLALFVSEHAATLGNGYSYYHHPENVIHVLEEFERNLNSHHIWIRC